MIIIIIMMIIIIIKLAAVSAMKENGKQQQKKVGYDNITIFTEVNIFPPRTNAVEKKRKEKAGRSLGLRVSSSCTGWRSAASRGRRRDSLGRGSKTTLRLQH